MIKLPVFNSIRYWLIVIFLAVLVLINYNPETLFASAPAVTQATEHYQKKYDFSEDWFTKRIPLWEEVLAPYKAKQNINYLEIGVFEGRSAIWMLENILTDSTAKMACIDTFPRQLYKTFIANLEVSGFSKKVTVIKGFSQIELRYLPLESFDIIYIDGSHAPKDVLADAVLSWGLLKKGGIMIFDDYALGKKKKLPLELRPQIAIDAFISVFKSDLKVIYLKYIAVVKKL